MVLLPHKSLMFKIINKKLTLERIKNISIILACVSIFFVLIINPIVKKMEKYLYYYKCLYTLKQKEFNYNDILSLRKSHYLEINKKYEEYLKQHPRPIATNPFEQVTLELGVYENQILNNIKKEVAPEINWDYSFDREREFGLCKNLIK